MDISTAFPSNYLKASDLNGKRASVTIQAVTMETLGDDNKPVIWFQGKEKGMVLNKTNANILVANYGTSDTDKWCGRSALIEAKKVEFQGRVVDALRFVLEDNVSQANDQLAEDINQAQSKEDIPF